MCTLATDQQTLLNIAARLYKATETNDYALMDEGPTRFYVIFFQSKTHVLSMNTTSHIFNLNSTQHNLS